MTSPIGKHFCQVERKNKIYNVLMYPTIVTVFILCKVCINT